MGWAPAKRLSMRRSSCDKRPVTRPIKWKPKDGFWKVNCFSVTSSTISTVLADAQRAMLVRRLSGPKQAISPRIQFDAFLECGILAHGCRLGLLEEGGGMLLHQAVQRGLLGSVALVVDRDTIQRPDRRMGLPANGLHTRLPRW